MSLLTHVAATHSLTAKIFLMLLHRIFICIMDKSVFYTILEETVVIVSFRIVNVSKDAKKYILYFTE